MKFWAIIIGGLIASAFIAVAVAGHINYTLTLDAPVSDGDQARFNVTRSAPNDGTEWVTLSCDGGVRMTPTGPISAKADNPVIWGTPDSLVGYVRFEAVYGTECTATLTETPWRFKHKDIQITFPVN